MKIIVELDAATTPKSEVQRILDCIRGKLPDNIADALRLAMRNAEARLYMLPLNADPTERQSLETEAATYRNALGA